MSTPAVVSKAGPAEHKSATPAIAHKPAPTKKKLHPLVHRYRKPAMIIAAVAAAIVTAYYVFDAYTHEETDDAYVTGHLHAIAPRIAATVTEVLVDDNQQVHQGQVLVKLDSMQYVALEMAAKANLDAAKSDYDRLKPLISTSAVAQQDVDNALSKYETGEAEYELAKLQIEYCTITAPEDGYVGDKTVETGNRLAQGTVLMSVVQEVWVVANYKETQVGQMVPGQEVAIRVDEIPGHIFTGRVDSLSPGSGSTFALLPPQNATGNFTKIVQRVPVKIRFDLDSVRGFETRLVPGLSVETDVALVSKAHAAEGMQVSAR